MFRMFHNWGPGEDLPDVGNVLADDTVGGDAGTYQGIAEGYVSFGEQYGADGTEFTGSGTALGTGLFFLRRR